MGYFCNPAVGLIPRYRFDTHDGDTFLEDDEGLDLDEIEAVRLPTQSGLADMACDVVPGDGPERTMVVAVRDQTGKIVLRATLMLMVEIQP